MTAVALPARTWHLRQGPLHELADAVSDHTAVFRQGMRRESSFLQGIIDGLAEIRYRVEQRPVEVEDKGFVPGHG